jgi:Fe-S oxidoreductase
MRLSKQVMTLAELLDRHPPQRAVPRLDAQALVHGHCHHKAVMGLTAEQKLLGNLGLDYHLLDSGCCGMAGSFGFTQQHYDTSLKIGELVLLPAVRKAEPDTLILADGFSCRQQIEQSTHRQGLHLADALYLALLKERQDNLKDGVKMGGYPERSYLAQMGAGVSSQRAALMLLGGLAVGAGMLFLAGITVKTRTKG